MADRTGIVMEIKNKKACIMTPGGEFLEVKIKGTIPTIGSVYTSSQVNKIPFYKYATVAASLLVFISTGGIAYAYYTPTASVTLNTSLELKLNRWNKIIKTAPLNKEGENLLNSLNVKNKNINDGLNLLVEKYENKEEKISLDITSEKNKDLDLSNFKDSSKEKN
ncbi:anti-sigma factor domain-containing protein [Clostridium bovifaecis]|uniref:Anti-sigma factor domain-containing protein n=1 Tax=Clostridium bovifaecis TaxID=2184719 RepID=A0A6I6F813_9CLOT|nr:anti-sigma factor domain-containing protein [Clostridium bovifaecis]